MKQAKSAMYFFLVAVLTAVLTGCPGPGPERDMNVNPGDAGPDSDGNVDVPDAGPDSEVLPDGGTDMGTDAGPNMCLDPEYVANECNLPQGMAYSRTEFLCADAIDFDRWITDEVGATPGRVTSSEVSGVLYSGLDFAFSNPSMVMPAGAIKFTCGNDGMCRLNWYNPDSNYSRCSVRFWNAAMDAPGCDIAETECWLPGPSSVPVSSFAVYLGPDT